MFDVFKYVFDKIKGQQHKSEDTGQPNDDDKFFEYISMLLFFKKLAETPELNAYKAEIREYEKSIYKILTRHVELTKGSSKVDVAVIGNFSSGKSLFINSFLADDVCPIDQKPTTSSVTKFYYSPKEEIHINGKPSTKEEYRHKVRHGTPGSSVSSVYVEYGYPSAAFSSITLYDSPGFENPNNPNDEKETLKLLKNADVVLYVVDINNGSLKNKEVKRLKNLKSEGKLLFCILNKSDTKELSSITKIKAEIENTFLFEKVIDYSSKNVYESLKDHPLQNIFETIQHDKIRNEEPFSLTIKGEKKEGLLKSYYKIFIDNKEIKIPSVDSIKKREEVLAMLNEIAMKKKPLQEKLLEQETKNFKTQSKVLIKNIIKQLEQTPADQTDTATAFEMVVEELFEKIEEYELSKQKQMKKAVVKAFEESISIPEAKEKSDWLTTYYKINFEKDRFNQLVQKYLSPHIDQFIDFINEHIAPQLKENYDYQLNIEIENAHEKIIQDALGSYYLGLIGTTFHDGSGIKYYREKQEATKKANSIKHELHSNIKNDVSFPLLQKELRRLNESGIQQKKQLFEKEVEHNAQSIHAILQELKNYTKE